MKIVLDESVPHQLVRPLRALGCDVKPFPNDWKGTKNGKLLIRVKEANFDALLTCDKNMVYQQNMSQLELLIVVLPTQRLDILRPRVEEFAQTLRSVTTFAGVLNLKIVDSGH